MLVWSADKFVEGAAATAKHLGMPSLLIGMVVVGFGTSAPEMTVSAFAAWEGNPALALEQCHGSNTEYCLDPGDNRRDCSDRGAFRYCPEMPILRGYVTVRLAAVG